MSDPIRSHGLIEVRTSIQMSQDSGNCKIRPALRYSNDGVTWDSAEEYPDSVSYVTTETTAWGTSYEDITNVTNTTVRAYVQFGVQAANEGGTNYEHCAATLRIEPKERL